MYKKCANWRKCSPKMHLCICTNYSHFEILIFETRQNFSISLNFTTDQGVEKRHSICQFSYLAFYYVLQGCVARKLTDPSWCQILMNHQILTVCQIMTNSSKIYCSTWRTCSHVCGSDLKFGCFAKKQLTLIIF